MTRMRNAALRLGGALLSVCLSATVFAQSQNPKRDSIAMRALRDELTRTMSELRLEKADRPYFVAYTMTERDGAGAAASFGSLIGTSSQSRSRMLRVEMRVGDYAFDNTNFSGMPPTTIAAIRTAFGLTELPLDDDYLEIRRQAWLATDAAYKGAVEAIAGKRAALLNRTRSDSLPDFGRADVTRTTDELPPVVVDLESAQALTRELSRAGSLPSIHSSTVSLRGGNSWTYYLNSEGTSWVRSRPMVTLSASASTQAADGMALSRSLRLYARSLDALPTRDQLTESVREMYAELDTLRNAAVVDRYNGPVLFEGRAAAELFSEQFASALAATRKPVSGNAQSEMFAALLSGSSARGGSSLADKLGARVLPDFLSVLDDPTRTGGGTAWFGGYTVDDQGVRAHPTRAVESGILKTFLTGRTPVEGVAGSTGNFRGGAVVPSNLIVESASGLSDAALRERLLALAKARGLPFAIIVRTMGDGGASSDGSSILADMLAAARPGGAERGRNVLLAYKIFADGHEECVRGAQVLGLNVEAFKGIVAASTSTAVLHRFGTTGLSALMQGGGEPSLSTFVVPSLLFDDLTITKRTDQVPKPPISEPPPT